MHPDDDTVGDLVSRVTAALGQQVELHVELAKAELARDAGALARDTAPLTLGIPLVSVGYGLTCVAAAMALSSWIGTAAGFAMVGALNLFVGGVAVHTSLSALRARSMLVSTLVPELRESAQGIVTTLRLPPSRIEVSPAR